MASSGRDGEPPEELPVHATETVKVLIGSNNNSGNTSCPDETPVWVGYLRGLKRQPSTQLNADAHLQFYGPRQRSTNTYCTSEMPLYRFRYPGNLLAGEGRLRRDFLESLLPFGPTFRFTPIEAHNDSLTVAKPRLNDPPYCLAIEVL